MAYKMKGFGGFGNSPAKDMKTEKYSHSFESPAKQKKKKGKLQVPIPKQNIGLQPGEMEGTWIYPGSDKRERMIDYDERAGVLEQNELMDIEYDLKHGKKFDRKAKGYKFPVKNKKKLLAKQKKLKKTIKNLDHEQQLMRDRS